MTRVTAAGAAVAAGLVLTGCAAGSFGSSDASEIVVGAASSTAVVLDLIVADWNASQEDTDVVVSYAGSASLREQVAAGAPIDVVITADEATMGDLLAAGHVDRVTPVATNAVVLAVRADSQLADATPAMALDPDLLLGVCAVGVPCGDAARSAAADADVTLRPDTETTSVRSLVRQLTDGELDVGVVYLTDIEASDGELVALDSFGSDTSNTYLAARSIDTANDGVTSEFVDFLVAPSARQRFVDAGFGLP